MQCAKVDNTLIGQRLRSLRGVKTLDEVSNATGIGRSALNMYELGYRTPRDEAKIALAAYYSKSVEEIFFTA